MAYFVVCLTMAEDTTENREARLAYLEPLRKATPEVKPVVIGLFAGAVLNDTEEFKSAGTSPKSYAETREQVIGRGAESESGVIRALPVVQIVDLSHSLDHVVHGSLPAGCRPKGIDQLPVSVT